MVDDPVGFQHRQQFLPALVHPQLLVEQDIFADQAGVLQVHRLALDERAQQQEQLLAVHRLGEVVGRAALEGVHGFSQRLHARDHHDVLARVGGLHRLEERQAVLGAEDHVGDHDLARLLPVTTQTILDALGVHDPVALAGQELLVEGRVEGVLLDDEDGAS